MASERKWVGLTKRRKKSPKHHTRGHQGRPEKRPFQARATSPALAGNSHLSAELILSQSKTGWLTWAQQLKRSAYRDTSEEP